MRDGTVRLAMGASGYLMKILFTMFALLITSCMKHQDMYTLGRSSFTRMFRETVVYQQLPAPDGPQRDEAALQKTRGKGDYS